MTRHVQGKEGGSHPLCAGDMLPADDLVVSMMESDCPHCRNAALVGPIGQKGCDLRSTVAYTPDPYEGAETALEEARARRDGR